MPVNNVNLFGLNINTLNYNDLLEYIECAVNEKKHAAIGYANAHILNGIYGRANILNLLNGFDIIHADGIGVYWALKKIYGRMIKFDRFTGSDFYPMLAQRAVKNGWSIFFFGHDENTLTKISNQYPNLKIAGSNEGYKFNEDEVIQKINSSSADILITGLGFPKQEEFIARNKNILKPFVSLIVGDGIKVFTGTKFRGPKWLRAMGLEWTIRLLMNPFKYWSRYIIGNPLFLYRIYRYKMAKLKKN